MNKVLLIIKREFNSRVKKRSFIIMTILGPLLFAALMIAPIVLMRLEDDEFKKVAVIDETGMFFNSIPNTKYLQFENVSLQYYDNLTTSYNLTKAKEDLKNTDYYALLYIPHTAVQTNIGVVQLISFRQPNMALKLHISNSMEKKLEDIKLSTKAQEFGLTEEDVTNILTVVNTRIDVVTTTLDEKGEEKQSSTEIAMIIGYICGFLIYMFVFMYGSMVMRGVIEEKTSRIVEVIVSSVKPFQLMIGKIIGVALVGLTQFLLWVVLTFVLVFFGQKILLKDYNPEKFNPNSVIVGSTLDNQYNVPDEKALKYEEAFKAVFSVNYLQVITFFLFYFIGGYLLYAAMFAIVGSAVDNETDTQQFMLPISLPLILGIIVMMQVINNPASSLSYWFSIIPFTSPIVMMVRIPFGVPIADLIISMLLLVISFVFMTWFAAKIYRVGILMYGKKVNYKELWKWFKYKN
ncbi:MAG: ABC transporter permease [Bacteroidales bacterium]|nr:ABC transporter permease [Bacteroidales bacterium]HOL98352.1 ABC transporter permease [Bacteroidales bacterium]HOM35710.1 ABC transporter permease [Bacteroidales bacterium]HPD23150.1 ABC transporter permease [Bacteroidales bacterium]HRS99079.1 ABC transporter permease [Bacteroidales bacterium]